LINRYTIIPLITDDYERAATLTYQHPLKAFDAIQLAVALRYQEMLNAIQVDIVFVSGDKTLNSAAQGAGLAIDNPFSHVLPQDSV